MKCLYCYHFMDSKILNPVRKVGEDLLKKCKVTKSKISIDSDTCQYFNPVTTFYCDINRQRLHILNCLQRRFNEKNLEDWNPCKSCRQFEQEVKAIIQKYYIETSEVLKLKTEKHQSGLKVRRKKKSKPLKRRRVKIAKTPTAKLKRRRGNNRK
jgi:hypothetical protein